jgi:hypothetical protein
MCCDHTVCSAQGKSVATPNTRHMQCLITSISRCNSGKSEWTHSNEEWSMTQLQTCQLFRVTKKSVRQCARRRVRHVGVAQASPLFSDHAPREVHLWQ